MASTYSSRLRLELIGNGEKVGTWGTVTNTNLGTLIEDAISGTANVSMTDANYTLTSSNGVADEARCAALKITGTLTATRNVICPSSSKIYVVWNATTGSQSITIRTSGGTGVTVTNGTKTLVYCDGTNVYTIIPSLGTAATYDIGTAGVTIPLLSTANTWTGAQVFQSTIQVDGAATLNSSLNVSGTMTGGGKVDAPLFMSTANFPSGSTLDLSLSDHFAKTVTSNTTWVFTNVPANGKAFGFTLRFFQASAYTHTWPAGMKWVNGAAPTFAAGEHIVTIFTDSGGTSYYASAAKGFA